jgi:trimethylamine---corrinoid protein Co-methyltransferase
MRVDTDQGRRILAEAGARVDEATHMVRFPEELVERSLSLATKEFSLGGRRPGWRLDMNAGHTTLLVDGPSGQIAERGTGLRRAATEQDVIDSLRLIDAIDEIGVYWSMVATGDEESTPSSLVASWRRLAANFSKHVNDSYGDTELAPWLLEIVDVVYGGRDAVRRTHPFSFLITPASPLVIEQHYTDMWLALRGYDVPAAVMPMPLMGATAPGSMIATIVQVNAEVIGTLCLVEAAEPGAPFLYAPVLAAMDPRTGHLAGGGIEHAVMASAGVEMARFYGLPVIASGCGTSTHVPGIQTAYEKATTAMAPMLSQPDIFCGPGSLGGATVFSFEELLLDVEILRICARAQRGVATEPDLWLQDVLERAEPAGDFLKEPSTRRNARAGEWYLSDLSVRDSYEAWEAAGRPDVLDHIGAEVDRILTTHEPLPLDADIVKELEELQKKADAAP